MSRQLTRDDLAVLIESPERPTLKVSPQVLLQWMDEGIGCGCVTVTDVSIDEDGVLDAALLRHWDACDSKRSPWSSRFSSVPETA